MDEDRKEVTRQEKYKCTEDKRKKQEGKKQIRNKEKTMFKGKLSPIED